MTTDPSRDAFEKWAKVEGYDTAHTYDTDRSCWVWLNPMTADLWKAWQAATAHKDELSTQAKPLSDELPQGFISDVLTAAGLVRHGRRCKALADRLGDAVEQIWSISIAQREALPAAPKLPPGE